MVRFEPNRALCQLCRILSLMAATFKSISIPIKALLKFFFMTQDKESLLSGTDRWVGGGRGLVINICATVQ